MDVMKNLLELGVREEPLYEVRNYLMAPYQNLRQTSCRLYKRLMGLDDVLPHYEQVGVMRLLLYF